MNIHPVLVHFPIALLTFYSIFECFRFRKLIESREWFYIKATFLFLGGLGALASAATGDYGKHLYPAARSIIGVHENFAIATIAVFGILALIYMGTFIDYLFGTSIRQSAYAGAWESIMEVGRPLFTAPLLISMAIVGLVLLLVTGALGGSVVYGVASDPMTQLVNQLFVK